MNATLFLEHYFHISASMPSDLGDCLIHSSCAPKYIISLATPSRLVHFEPKSPFMTSDPPPSFPSPPRPNSSRQPTPQPLPPHPPHRPPGFSLPRPLPQPLGPPRGQILQPEIPPRDLPLRLRGARDAERGVLVRHHVVFVFGVGRLVVRGHEDGFVGKVRRSVEFLGGGINSEGGIGGGGLLRRGRRRGVGLGARRCERCLWTGWGVSCWVYGLEGGVYHFDMVLFDLLDILFL